MTQFLQVLAFFSAFSTATAHGPPPPIIWKSACSGGAQLLTSGVCDKDGNLIGGTASPLTTKGDVWGYSTTDARIPIGADGTVLTADSAEALGLKWAAAGSGDFSGPVSSTDNGIVRFDGTGGKTGQNSSITIDDNGDMFIADGDGAVVGHTAFVATDDDTPELQVHGTTAGDAGAMIGRWSADATAAKLSFLKSRNATIGSNTNLSQDDDIGSISFYADTSTGYYKAAEFLGVVSDSSPGVGGTTGGGFEWWADDNAGTFRKIAGLNDFGQMEYFPGSASRPSLNFGDANSGFYSNGAGFELYWDTNGSTYLSFTSSSMVWNQDRANVDYIIYGDNELNSFYFDAGVERFNLGWGGSPPINARFLIGMPDDEVGFAITSDNAQTANLVEYADSAGTVEAGMDADFIRLNHVDAGLTAGTTQTQAGGLDLVAQVNEVSTVANTNDTVVLPAAPSTGSMSIKIFNNGANTMQIFPASGDNLGAGVDTATTLTAGSNVTYTNYDATNWEAH